jgi:hypothetical protein
MPMPHRSRLVTWVALVALPPVLLAAGCDTAPTSPSSAAAPASSGGATTQTFPGSSTAPAPSGSAAAPVATTTPVTKAALTAADGSNLKACSDGKCEVIVESGDSLPNASGMGAAKVTVRNGRVTLATAKGSNSSTVSGTERVNLQIEDQLFVVVAIQGDQAVLRMSKI